jgi:hypothetical protein
LNNAPVRAAATNSGWSSGMTPFTDQRTQERDSRALEEGAHVVPGARPGHALADEDEPMVGFFVSAKLRRLSSHWRLWKIWERSRRMFEPAYGGRFGLSQTVSRTFDAIIMVG